MIRYQGLGVDVAGFLLKLGSPRKDTKAKVEAYLRNGLRGAQLKFSQRESLSLLFISFVLEIGR